MAIAYVHRAELKIESGKAKNACKDLETAVALGNKKASELFSQHCVEEEKPAKEEEETSEKKSSKEKKPKKKDEATEE